VGDLRPHARAQLGGGFRGGLRAGKGGTVSSRQVQVVIISD